MDGDGIMSSRMDKYNFDNLNNVGTRTKKNNDLYAKLAANKIKTDINDLDNNNNVVEISSFDTPQVNMRHRNLKKVELDSIDNSYKNTSFYDNIFGDDLDSKNYDVNDVISHAKKNRTDEDEEEKQKRLKNIEYSILSDLSKDKIQEYHERKKSKGITQEEEDNLEELINTITSKKLRNDIDDELFGDLMPASPDETLISSNLLDELKNEKLAKLEKESKNEHDSEELIEEEDLNIDKSFYTHSMDLKREDLVVDSDDNQDSDELDESFKEEKGNTGKIIIIVLLILLIIGIIGFCIYKFM